MFKSYVCDGDTVEFEKDGFTFVAEVAHDGVYHIDDDDCHNEDRSGYGSDEEYARSMEARLAWFNNEWFYCGIIVTVSKNGVDLGEQKSLWGIEANYPGSENGYFGEVATELTDEMLSEGLEDAVQARAHYYQELIEKLVGLEDAVQAKVRRYQESIEKLA